MHRILRLAPGTVGLLLALALTGKTLPQGLEFERDRAILVLNQVSDFVRKNHYDPQLRGLDWKALTEQARQRIEQAKTVDGLYMPIFVLVDALQDLHTKFIPPGRAARIQFGFDAKLYGDEVFVYKVRKKGAAEAAGMQVGDQILAVNGFKAERATFKELMLFLRVLQPVTVLELVVQRGSEPRRTLRIEAQVQPEALVEDLTKLDNIYRLIREAQSEDEKSRSVKYPDGIGYLQLPDFILNPDSLDGFVKKVQGSRALVIDLRDNAGGLVIALTTFAGFFEPEGQTMFEIIRREKTEAIKIKPLKPSLDVPLFILVDSESASASESFTRHFQRNGRAVVIGDRTFGYGNVSRFFSARVGTQTVILTGVNVAIGRAVFPGGEELEKRGITPDRKCIPTGDDLRNGRDPCLALALSLAREKVGLARAEGQEKYWGTSNPH